MSAERSTKRRKLNPTGEAAGQTRTSLGKSSIALGDLTTTKQAARGRGSTAVGDVVDHCNKSNNAKHSTPRSPSRQTSAAKLVQHEVQDNQEDENGSAKEEIVVRSSGRVRRLPVKLKEDDHVVVSRAANNRTKSKSRTPVAARTSNRPSTESPTQVLQDLAPATTPSTAKRKRTTKSGKENVTPPVAAAISVEPMPAKPQVISSVEQPASAPNNKQKRSRPRVQQLQVLDSDTQEQPEVLDHTDDGHKISARALTSLRKELLARAAGRQAFQQIDREAELATVATLIKQAVETGESNSMLLIGSRGTGKTALINEVLRAQQATHADEFHIVRLNGFIHTDDKLALRDIWRQLGREMKLEDKDTDVRSYADTLSMLLALLSRPQELDQSTNPDQVTKSVIFILDEFDLFATHPRQTLLYNLFDIAQSRKAPIAVIGLTTRVDVVEALEKRVKSRFSHRYVHLAPAKTLAAFTKICKATLTLPDDAQEAKAWNAAVESVMDNEHLALHTRKIYHRSKSIPDFLTSMLMPLGTLPVDTAMTAREIVDHFGSTTSMASLGPDSKLDVLSALSSLQLALLICAARQNAIYAAENITFNLAYEEYKAIAGKAKLQATASGALGAGSRVWGKDVARNAWTDLIGIGLIIEDGRGIGKVDIALEEIAGSNIELGQWARWCRDLMKEWCPASQFSSLEKIVPLRGWGCF
ncbi:hypothetical protein AMS68_006189 [Peltaster fructicola]|uniref:Origin recognition complex subunit 4 n=1 Tax=Peltaster fructicola TaxID=286661 RepID=A0A6H0Y0W4_9PEZI|nr:hypothetical protein AMS68_006189 [Peltaster fructicola]